MRGLEEDMQVQSGLVALIFLKHSGDNHAREAGLDRDKGESFGGQDAGSGLLRRLRLAYSCLAASDHQQMRGDRHVDCGRETIQAVAADREPASGIKQVARIVTYVRQLEAGHGAVVAGFELPFIFESKRLGRVLGQACRQRNTDRRVLGDALGGKSLVLFVGNLGDAQVIVQFEYGDVQILHGREFDLDPCLDLVQMGFELGVDLVVVYAQARLFRSPRWGRAENDHQQGQGTRKDA